MATLYDNVTSTSLTTSIGSTPAAGDTVVLDTQGVYFASGVDISTNEIEKLVIGRGFTGGTAESAKITVDLSAGTYTGEFVSNYSGRDVRIEPGGTGAKINTSKVISTGIGTLYFVGSGDLGTLEMSGGGVHVSSDTTISGTFNVAGGSVTIEDHASDAIGTINVSGTGVLTLRRDTTNVNQYAGAVKLDEDGAAVTNLVLAGGVFRHEGNTGMTTATVRSGATLDLRNVSGDLTIATLTTETSSTVLYPKNFNVTITTHNKLANAEPLTE